MNQLLTSDYVVFGLWVTLEQQVTLDQQVNLDYQDDFKILWMNQRQISDYVVWAVGQPRTASNPRTASQPRLPR